MSVVAALCESPRSAQILAAARAELDARYQAAAERTRRRGDRYARSVLTGPPKGWQS